MSISIAIAQQLGRNVVTKTARLRTQTPWILGLVLSVFLFTPTFTILPINSEAINRPLNDLLDLALVGVWILLALLYWPRAIIRPRWLAFVLWLPPLSYLISIYIYAVTNLQLDFKQIYILLFSLRPLAMTGITILICRWYQLSLAAIYRSLRLIVWIVAFHAVYVSLLAYLQILQISAAQQFLYSFYQYQLANTEIVFEAVTRYGRASSIFHWPNSLSVFLVIGIFLMVAYVGNSGRKLWVWLPILCSMGGAVLAGSRTGLAILFLGLLLIALYKRHTVLLVLLCVGALAVGSVISFVELETDQVSRLYELFDWIRGVGPMPLTFQLRILNWREAISYYISQSTALTGITIIGKRTGNLTVDSFDSEYLVYFVWNGIIGFFAFLFFQLGLLFYSVRLILRPRGPKAVRILSLFMLLVTLTFPLIAVSQEVWSQQRLIHLVFICFGLLIYSRNLANQEKQMVLQTTAFPDSTLQADGDSA